MKNKNIKRIIHRCLEELKATIRIAKVVGVKKAIITLVAKIDIQIMNHNGYYENKKRKKHLIDKHNIMIEYYENTFKEYLKNYKKVDNSKIQGADMSDTIWICWWQGLDNAPKIVKRCIESIKKHSGSHRVIIITEENYKDYITVPKEIEQKKEAGIITRTNYSDLLRLSLLAEHGGMWLDSTFYCVSDEIQEYFKLPLWSIKRPDYFHASVASGYFAGYSLYCNRENRYIFATIKDLFIQYWLENDFMVDYLMVDYMIVLAQRLDERIKNEFFKIPENNKNCDELFKYLPKRYEDNIWSEMKENTCLFKLSWKYNYQNNKDTFYDKFINDDLEEASDEKNKIS